MKSMIVSFLVTVLVSMNAFASDVALVCYTERGTQVIMVYDNAPYNPKLISVMIGGRNIKSQVENVSWTIAGNRPNFSVNNFPSVGSRTNFTTSNEGEISYSIFAPGAHAGQVFPLNCKEDPNIGGGF